MQRRSTVCVVQKLNVRSAAYFDILPSVWAAFVLQ
nr:MAG TPA: hypothetical protein [Caudoviricetes sp.]